MELFISLQWHTKTFKQERWISFGIGCAPLVISSMLIFLFPPAVAILAGAAEAIGELSGYGLGYSGRGAVERHRLYPVGRRWMQKRGGLVLLIAASVPNPAFDLLGIIAGGLHYPVRRFLLAVWIGKTIKSFGIVYACQFGFADMANRIPNWLAS